MYREIRKNSGYPDGYECADHGWISSISAYSATKMKANIPISGSAGGVGSLRTKRFGLAREAAVRMFCLTVITHVAWP
jgi:citrate synthase